jgi:zinc transporter ZupT
MVRTEIVLAVALINFLAAFVGVVLILWNRTWSERNLRWGIGFGAGLLIGISMLEIIPTAIDLAGEHAMIYVLLGFVGFFLMEKCTREEPGDCAGMGRHFHFTLASFIALCLHALLDGMVIGLGLHLNEAFGLVIFVAILFHKLPLAISLAGVFLRSSKKRTAVIQMLIFALATPLGLVATVAFLSNIPGEFMGAVVGVSAGLFLYLGATDMLPEIAPPWQDCEAGNPAGRKPPGRWATWEPVLWVLAGMIVSFVPHLLLEG